jgi:DNA-binding XRE family transcriptional regulator
MSPKGVTTRTGGNRLAKTRSCHAETRRRGVENRFEPWPVDPSSFPSASPCLRVIKPAERRSYQGKLAELADLNVSYIGFLERGENVPTLTIVLNLAHAMDVRASDLIREVARKRYLNQCLVEFRLLDTRHATRLAKIVLVSAQKRLL